MVSGARSGGWLTCALTVRASVPAISHSHGLGPLSPGPCKLHRQRARLWLCLYGAALVAPPTATSFAPSPPQPSTPSLAPPLLPPLPPAAATAATSAGSNAASRRGSIVSTIPSASYRTT